MVSSELLKRALDESGHGIVVTNFDGVILQVSEKVTELTGYSEKHLLGSTPKIFKSGQTPAPTYRELWETIRSGRTWNGALLNRHKDGRIFLDRETILSGISGGRACFVAIHRDSNFELDLRLKIARAESSLGQKLSEIEDAKSTIKTLVTLTAQQAEGASHVLIATLEARDPQTAGHGRRTSLLMDLIGEELGLFSRYSRDMIRIGAILHDLGKIGIPDAILLKEGRLTDPEYEVIKTHPDVGFGILSQALQQEEPLRIVRHHHERLDGSGYPDKLRGPEIPDYVRAFSVCDCFDAMTSARSYRRAIPAEDALSMLTDDALTGKLDMSAVKALKRLWRDGILGDLKDIAAAA